MYPGSVARHAPSRPAVVLAETGETVVDVAVDESEAADLASRAATRKVALVLDSRER